MEANGSDRLEFISNPSAKVDVIWQVCKFFQIISRSTYIVETYDHFQIVALFRHLTSSCHALIINVLAFHRSNNGSVGEH